MGCVKLELEGTSPPVPPTATEISTLPPARRHFLYARVAFAHGLQDALDLAKDMRVVANEINAAARDLEAFAEKFDFTQEPA